MKALAFSNNDIALVAWTYDARLSGCLGFAIYRVDAATGVETPLPALARFSNVPKNVKQTTEQAPVQKFWWKDLTATRGGIFRYKVVPLGGVPGHLHPLANAQPLVSNTVALTHDRGAFKAYFNRGIVATQAVAHELGNHPTANALMKRIKNPQDSIRRRLEGELFAAVTSLLDRADNGEGNVIAALYELNDPDGLERRLQANPARRTVILGNERSTNPKTKKDVADVDADNRLNLKQAGVAVIDRILPKNAIPHNKFNVLMSGTQAHAVMTGSTNWTSTGLCTQTNNVLIIESPNVARVYADYWAQLRRDVTQAGTDPKQLQGPVLRSWTRAHNDAMIKTPIALEDGSARVEVFFSPNTKKQLASPPKEKPNDVKRLFDLVGGAKHAILFLAFDPGNNSILDAAGAALRKNPKLFVRGALTSAVRAANFTAALKGKGTGKTTKTAHVAVIGEPGGSRKKTPKAGLQPDYRAVPAGAIDKTDVFGAFEAELYKVGFAIIHNKVVVIDPFSDDCVVITGSHNLGYRASHNNDENMVVIHGHRPLAEAYACHVLDLYDHYAWRYWLRKFPKKFGKPLDETDKWQDNYIKGAEEKSAELRFWLSATPVEHV